MPKNAMEPTPKFDCHVSKNANKVTTLLSYRAFELTQVKRDLVAGFMVHVCSVSASFSLSLSLSLYFILTSVVFFLNLPAILL